MCFRMNQYVGPACIMENPKYKSLNGLEIKELSLQDHYSKVKYLEVAVYGQTGLSGDKSNKLLKLSLQLVEQTECENLYNNLDGHTLERGIDEGQFCAKGVHSDRIKKDPW